jgi:alpha-D-ribose 1-methylphosphonate 5-triphosphate synthase subunit PhnH
MVKETEFDFVMDAQRAFRTLLDAFSHPGIVYNVAAFELSLPNGFSKANTLIALSLFDNNISFSVSNDYSNEVESFIMVNTNARQQSFQNADYVFFKGHQDIVSLLDECNKGDLMYPEKNATVIIEVTQISNQPFHDQSIDLALSGPGIENTNTLYVQGIHPANIDLLKVINTEFPLGIDILITDQIGQICAITRSTIIQSN